MGAKRPEGRLPETRQTGMFLDAPAAAPVSKTKGAVRFQDRDPREIFVGAERLDAYLTRIGSGWVVKLREQLGEVDFSALTELYQDRGRWPFHPRVMVGLVVYGILLKQWSLRDLEGLAARDVGAWFICGGHQPDHSTIGKFLELHRETLSEEFFASLTRQLVTRLGTQGKVAAIDGTVIEAASSRFRLLKAEAARQAAREAVSAAKEKPEDEGLAATARQAQTVAEMVTAREQKQKAKGKESTASIVPAEPEAVMQPRKDGVVRPAYKPSVLVSGGLILAQQVDSISETAVFPTLLKQAASVTGRAVETALADAGYFSLAVLQVAVDRDLNLLCPSGQTRGDDWDKAGPDGRFAKNRFVFNDKDNAYLCPAGQPLVPLDTGIERGIPYQRYATKACKECPIRGQCTKGARRTVKRYEGDELKDAMQAVLAQPAARAVYRQRKAIVEPIFAELRERQGLRRFHRRGIHGAKLEFSLHCIALNLKKTVAGVSTRFSFIFLWSLHSGTPRLILAIASLSIEPNNRV
jgi:transposase